VLAAHQARRIDLIAAAGDGAVADSGG